MSSAMASTSANLEPLFSFLSTSYATLEQTFNRIPGSAVIARYVKSSHQNDPGRTLLELFLAAFAIWTLLQSRTRADKDDRHFIKFTEKEIDELVNEWTPEPLAEPLSPEEQKELESVPVIVGAQGPRPKLNTGKTVLNFTGTNFTGLAGNEGIKEKAIETLRKYGLGSCGPPGFYGTVDVHVQLEHDIADFLGTEDAILYAQGYSTISSVIPAFAKRGDIIVADRGVNFAIQKGIQISRSTVRWFDHNDLKSLEDVLQGIAKERKKKKAPLTKMFIVTEGIFEKDGVMTDLPKLIELKYKYKYRLILDESISFGSVGRTGRGLTELFNVPASQVDMLVGSVANGLASCGGFCAGSKYVVYHQRINSSAFVFSASMPPLLSVSASEGVNILRNTPSILSTLQENIRTVRGILDKLDCITIPSHPASAMIHIYIRTPTPTLQIPTGSGKPSNPTSIHPRDPPTFDIETEERLLQDVVDEALAQGVLITRARRLRGQEMVEARPSIRLAVSAAFSKKECEKAANVVKAALVKVLGKRR
ncbi:serine palmitoyltransferase [Gloeophyllum trabeum ATCC 11539]|uniref:serine C-palmitoyltransferase n=1 Tax=Gloeophyllum trabeum (strain ATCC 11539 / FP-39264 / Madison 617) TaxID=670483 RepID=S7PTM0_GLOTA|nr:serine palmitoyltransferase [Gloeophyllum trabeum ATCC 11539]EPQ50783.1 serine palmitoyltransferase [Gloeophyllum trabeum ATCC 11539]